MAEETEESVVDTQTQTQTQNSQIDWPEQHTPASIPVIWGRIYSIRESQKALGMTGGRTVPSHKLNDYYDLTTPEFTVGRALSCNLCLRTDTFVEVKNISKLHFSLTRDCGKEVSPIFIEDHSYNGTFVNGKKLGKGQRRVLDNDDEICLAHPLMRIFIFRDLTNNKQDEAEEIVRKYYISRTLGIGAWGIVKCVYNKSTCTKYAMKIVKKRSLGNATPSNIKQSSNIANEVTILKCLKHPCVITTEEVIETNDAVYMVMELMEGGELFERISARGKLPEKLCKIYFRQMVLAVIYLHEMGVTHRDLKPENVLLETQEEETLLKLSDFGLSKFVGEESFMKTLCGTPLYLAPEVLIGDGQTSYGSQVDVWSLGVILFICLSGYLPFSEDYKKLTLREQIIKGKYTFSRSHWQGVSMPARQLMTRMLTVDPKKRISLAQIMRHKWMQDYEVTAIVDNLMRREEQVTSLQEMSLGGSSKENQDSSNAPSVPKRMLSDSCRSVEPRPKRLKITETFRISIDTKSDDTSLADDDDTIAVIDDF